MKKIIKNLLVLSLLINFSACSVQQNFYFKEDFSGRVEYTLDMSMMGEFMKGMQGSLPDSLKTGSDAQVEGFDKMLDSLLNLKIPEDKQKDGISNMKIVNIDGNKYKIKFTFDFRDLNALNQAMLQTQGVTPDKDTEMFKMDGKKFVFTGVKFKATDVGQQQGNMKPEEMGEMDGFFTFQYKLVFDKEVRQAKGENCSLERDGNTVIFNVNYSNMTDEQKLPKVVVDFQ
jgi:hypothetical protein